MPHRVRMRLVAPGPAAEDCRRDRRRRSPPNSPGRHPVGLLVLGDGSNRHGDRAPAARDDRAGPFDDQVGAALAAADPAALLALDAALAAELDAVGRAAWQVLAGRRAGRRRPVDG